MADRLEHDEYHTPSWVVDRLMEAEEFDQEDIGRLLTVGSVLEPSAGNGSLIRAFRQHGVGDHWTAVEIQEKHTESLRSCTESVFIGDFLELGFPSYDVIIGNPPYSLCFEFAKKAVMHADIVIFLLRLGFISTSGRHEWLSRNTPSIYVVPQRPSFKKGGGTDRYDYAWFVWDSFEDRPTVSILNLTPKEERRG